MSVPKPGDYITAKCGRCSDITGHVVMIVIDGAILKVECKACGSVHKYRDTQAKPAAKSTAGPVRHVRAGQSRDNAKELGNSSARRTSAAPARPKTAPGRSETAWQEAMTRHSGETPAPYSMQSAYAPQAFIEHPVFGRGEALAVTRPDKVEILFQEGVKILRCKL